MSQLTQRFSQLPRFKQWLFGLLVLFNLAIFVVSMMPRATGAPYVELKQPGGVPVTVDGKVTVRSVFMYHCQYCYESEPEIEAWAKGQANQIHFERVAMPAVMDNDPEARLFLTLQHLEIEDKFHALIMKTIHSDGNRFIHDEESILNWVALQDIDQAKFLGTWRSPDVEEKLHNLPKLMNELEVTGTPSLVVGGRYLTSPSAVNRASTSANPVALGQILDRLVALSRQTN